MNPAWMLYFRYMISSSVIHKLVRILVPVALVWLVAQPMGSVRAEEGGAVSSSARLQTRVLSAGSNFVCAILGDGSVKCWGNNSDGRLGIGSTAAQGDGANEMGDSLARVDLGPGRTAAAISAGNAHVCVILDNGAVKCWGQNDSNSAQLGLGDFNNRGDNAGEMGANLPAVDLGPGRTATAIAAGGTHTCAILDNGAVKCWGRSNRGQLGYDNSNTVGGSSSQMGANLPQVNLGLTAKAITAGDQHTCAILSNDSLKCWGGNLFGQLGIESTVDTGDTSGEMAVLSPVSLPTGRTVRAISAGAYHTCAVLDNGALACWGYNNHGQLGVGSTFNRGDGSGEMGNSTQFADLGAGRTATAVAAGDGHTCVVLDNARLKCWGSATFGAIGSGSSTTLGDNTGEMGDNLPPVELGSGRTVLAVTANGSSTCVVLDDGSVKCWGNNSNGQLGYGDTVVRGTSTSSMGANLPALNFGTNLRVSNGGAPTTTTTVVSSTTTTAGATTTTTTTGAAGATTTSSPVTTTTTTTSVATSDDEADAFAAQADDMPSVGNQSLPWATVAMFLVGTGVALCAVRRRLVAS